MRKRSCEFKTKKTRASRGSGATCASSPASHMPRLPLRATFLGWHLQKKTKNVIKLMSIPSWNTFPFNIQSVQQLKHSESMSIPLIYLLLIYPFIQCINLWCLCHWWYTKTIKDTAYNQGDLTNHWEEKYNRKIHYDRIHKISRDIRGEKGYHSSKSSHKLC